MLHLLQMGPSKMLTTFPLQIQILDSSHSWSCIPPFCASTRKTKTLSSVSSDMYTSTVQSSPPLLMLHSAPPSSSNLLSPVCPFCILSFCPLTTVPCSWLSFYASYPLSPADSLRVLQWNAGDLRARSTELLHFLSSHPVDLICIQEFNFNSSSSFRIPGFSALRSNRTHSRSGILSPDPTHATGGVIIFVRQGLSFSKLSTSSLSSLDSYSDYAGVNISLNNFSSVSFLNVYASRSFAPLQRVAEPIPSLPPSFPPLEISSFLGTSIAITPSGTQEVLPTSAGRKYSTGSSPLTSSPSMTLTHPPFSIAPLAVAPLLTSPLLLLLLPFLALGTGFRTWVLTTYQFFYLSLSLRSFAPTSVLLPLIFRKLAGMALSPTLTLTVPLQRNTRLYLFSPLLLSLPLWH